MSFARAFALLALASAMTTLVSCAGEAPSPAASPTAVTTAAASSAEATSAPTAAGSGPSAIVTDEPGPTATAAQAKGNTTSTPSSAELTVSPATLALGPGLHDFTLPDAHGGEVTLSQYLGEKVVVLTFYRAWW